VTVPVRPIENRYAALWQSVATEVAARHRAAGGAPEHGDTLLDATQAYVEALVNGQPPPPPPPGHGPADRDPAVGPYLALLHHRLAHARINGDAALQAQLQQQLGEFRFGNPLWEQMLIQYFAYYGQYPYHKGAQPLYRSWKAEDGGRGDPDFGVVEWRLPAHARIAVVGDIGTGTDVAAAVLASALSFRPDAILHLGDVYFSGTPFEFAERYTGLFETVFQSLGHRVPVFGVPGNHEYFTGGIAYLDCLSSGKLAPREDQRQAASYFCLRSEDGGWQFLGLDTGFYGHTMAVSPKAEADALHILHATDPAVPDAPPPAAPASGGSPSAAAPATASAAAGSPSVSTASPSAASPGTAPPAAASPTASDSSSSAAPATTGDGGADLPVELPSSTSGMVHVRDDEAEWHRHQMERFGGRTVLLSHHQLYSAAETCGVPQGTVPGPDGTPVPDPADFNRPGVNTLLWRQFGPHFGSRVAAWIWGHEHNLGIFQDGYRPADWPLDSDEAKTVFRALPKGRCAGHAAIPVAASEEPYATHNPVPLLDDSLRLGLVDGWYNRGFEIIELAGAGRPARVRYYQLAGADPTPLLVHAEEVE
jgi:3',5'-cyclic AMP phosphodiesterase CpdA